MKTYYYAINSLYKLGSIHLLEQPWWLFIIEYLNDYSCSFVPPIPFPDIFPAKRDSIKGCPNCDGDIKKEPCKDHDDLYTLQEWYGNLRQWYCGKVCRPIFQWIWKHPKRKEYPSIEVGYDKIKELFYESAKKYFDENEMIEEEYESHS